VIQADDGRGVRLVVNETPYSPMTAGQGCLAIAPDPASRLPAARFAAPQPSTHSFVLADRLAYCRFSYLVKLNQGPQPSVPKWQPAAPGSGWPLAMRVEMAPLESDPSQLQPITVTAPIYVYRSPQIEYDDH
jgi:hypothetical protein